MANPNQRLGVVEVTVGGVVQDIVPGTATIMLGGKTRTTQDSDQGGNFSTAVKPASVEFEVFYGPGTSLATYQGHDDVPVVARCDTGQVYTLANAWLDGDPPAPKAGDGGKHKLKYVAKKAVESK